MSMWGSGRKYRTVVYDDDASAFIDSQGDDYRFNDIWGDNEGLEFLLCRNPEVGMKTIEPVGGKHYWIYSVAADPIANTRPLVLMYSFDNDHLYMHRVAFTDEL